MIMKADNFRKFMCPLTITKEKPISCRGTTCAAFTGYHLHPTVCNDKPATELWYFCGLAAKPPDFQGPFEYPSHKKELHAHFDLVDKNKNNQSEVII